MNNDNNLKFAQRDLTGYSSLLSKSAILPLPVGNIIEFATQH